MVMPPLFSQRALDADRAAQTFDLSAHVHTRSTVREPGGREVVTWPYSGVSYPARLAPVRSDEPVVLGRADASDLWSLTLPWDAILPRTGRVVVEGDVWGSARTFEVVGVKVPRSYQIVARYVVKEIHGA